MLQKEKQTLQYYLFSLSNLISAFAGGTILGKGLGVLAIHFLQSGSLFAFFIGTFFGLIFLQFIPKNWSNSIAKYFSILAAISSLVLCLIFQKYSINEKLYDSTAILFFSILSLRFGFWFYSRVLRASAAAGQQQQIAWVELGYFIGIILGLVIWKFFNIEISLSMALIIDACLQFFAGCIDIIASQIQLPSKNDSGREEKIVYNRKSEDRAWLWRLASAVALLTIAFQVSTFMLAQHVSEKLSGAVLAVFYLGAAIGSAFCKKFKIQLEWYSHHKEDTKQAVISCVIKDTRIKINFSYGLICGALCLCFSMIFIIILNCGMFFKNNNEILYSWFSNKEILLLILITFATFCYQVLELALLDRIGLEELAINCSGMIIRTYSLMSVSAAFCFAVLGLTNTSLIALLVTLFLPLILTVVLVRKRTYLPKLESLKV